MLNFTRPPAMDQRICEKHEPGIYALKLGVKDGWKYPRDPRKVQTEAKAWFKSHVQSSRRRMREQVSSGK